MPISSALLRLITILALAVVAPFAVPSVEAGDWPMWRYDAGRSAASPDDLPETLTLKWTRSYPQRIQTWDDPLNNDLMQFDKVFEPIVLGDCVYVGYNDSDKLACFDVDSGKEQWRFYTEGPVRFPPVGWNNKVFLVSDDGHLYCLDAKTGQLQWKFRGGPSARKVLGNKRVISMWAARGGPVVRDGKVYFAASIWPMMGTFLYSLDAESGQVEWVNDSTSASYIKQPHSAPSFAGVAPQGAIAATKDHLVVPGGRSIPAVFDRHTGQLVHFHLNAGGKGTGGSFVMADDENFFVHTRLRGVRKFDMLEGKKTATMVNEPVLDGDLLYTSDAESVKAMDAARNVVWELPIDGRGDLIRAGGRLYAAGENAITAIDLNQDRSKPGVWTEIPVTGEVLRLVAGGETLFAITLDGRIQAFGKPSSEDQKPHVYGYGVSLIAPSIEPFLERQNAADGYAFVFGIDDELLLDKLISGSKLQLVAVDTDERLVQRLRRKYDDQGLYGSRVAIHVGSPESFEAPPYIAHLVAVGKEDVSDLLKPKALQSMYESVRPYGGTLWFPLAKDKQAVETALSSANLAKSIVEFDSATSSILAKRVGALEGSAPWTHLYGDIANTVKSNDRRVKLPLGILWFGGNTHMDVLPRHSHAPCEQVIGGRLFIEGMNSMSARDVYTGRMLWHREFEDLGTSGIYFDHTYKNTPLSTAYNQVHIPGANSRGTNFVATEDHVYLVIENECHLLDAVSGETTQVFKLPKDGDGVEAKKWTYIGIYGDILLAGADYADYSQHEGYRYLPLPRKSRAWSPEWYGSSGLVALNRKTGEPLWRVQSRYSFLHNGIVAGNETVFLLDKLPKSIESYLERRGRPKPEDYRILALNAQTGEQRWEATEKVFGTWFGYSEPRDILVQAGSAAPDRATDEVDEGLIAYRGADGSVLWEAPGAKYSGPFIIHNDQLISNSRSYAETSGVLNLLDGAPVLIENPLTGEQEPWQYARAYGCNTAVASEHLLTFRSGAAGYYDLDAKCGVGNLGGFRSGCSSNLIVADGVLNAPDFTRTCSCGYQNQTSLALVPMPDVETWSLHFFDGENSPGRIKHVGINFGAPGSRRAADGTLWLAYPPVASEKIPVEIEIDGTDLAYYRRHSSVASGDLPWVAASGVKGISTIKLKLPTPPAAGASDAESTYTLRLHFAEPEKLDGGKKRIFDVAINGEDVISQLDVAASSGANWKGIARTIAPVLPQDRTIAIEFRSETPGLPPILSGIELIAD